MVPGGGGNGNQALAKTIYLMKIIIIISIFIIKGL